MSTLSALAPLWVWEALTAVFIIPPISVVSIKPESRRRIYWTNVSITVLKINRIEKAFSSTRYESIIDTKVQLFYPLTSGLIAFVRNARWSDLQNFLRRRTHHV